MLNSLLLVLGVLVVFALWLRWREPHMLYYPDRQIDETPDKHGWKYEDVYITTSDNVRINGWFIPAPNAPQSSRSTILFLHGNAGNISHRMEKLEVFRDLGVDTFIIDYRGYGRSEGTPNEEGTYRDAEAAYNYVTELVTGEPRAAVAARTESDEMRARKPAMSSRGNPSRVVVYGESLGAAVAVDLATKHPVGGVVIEAAFTSVGDVGQKMFPFLPVRWLVRNKYDTLSKMPRVNAPVLILHSRDDDLISVRHGERLLAAAHEPKQLVELHGGHNDAFLASADTYRSALEQFFSSLKLH